MKAATLAGAGVILFMVVTVLAVHFTMRVTGRDRSEFMSRCAAQGNLTVEGCAMTWGDLEKEKR